MADVEVGPVEGDGGVADVRQSQGWETCRRKKKISTPSPTVNSAFLCRHRTCLSAFLSHGLFVSRVRKVNEVCSLSQTPGVPLPLARCNVEHRAKSDDPGGGHMDAGATGAPLPYQQNRSRAGEIQVSK